MIYQIVEAPSMSELEVQVNALLRSGWYCQGGITVRHDCIYCQAMIKAK